MKHMHHEISDSTSNPEQHNAAHDMAVTALVAGVWDRIAEPLADHVFSPLKEKNPKLALAALNLTLTAPRAVEPAIGNYYIENVERGERGKAALALGASALLAMLDGVDGAAARKSDLTSEFGAGFDPAVDLFGSFSIARQVKRLAESQNDTLTAHLMNLRLAVDAYAIVSGGAGNTIATKYASGQGVQLEAREQSKANAASKAKYAVGSVGTVAIRASHILPEKVAKPTKLFGQAMVIGSIAIGVRGGAEYTKSAISTFKRGQAASRARSGAN